MIDNAGTLYISNGVVEPSNKLGDIDVQKSNVVYEVIRIIEKVPLFLEDHYIRLKNSLSAVGAAPGMTEQELSNEIRRLVEANGQVNCNVKLIVYNDNGTQNYALYISKSYYPVRSEIEKGVKVSLLRWERESPNVKVINNKYKEAVSKKMAENNVFEVLLVNNAGQITEGSKSNLFFVKDSKVYTAPGDYVLKGITRQYIFDACKRAGAEVVESLIDINSLDAMDGLFISGTSIKVLPVSEVDGHPYQSGINPTIIAIRDRFDGLIKEYIDTHGNGI